MHNFLIETHTILRWFILLGLIFSIGVAAIRFFMTEKYIIGSDRFLFKITLILTHVQILIGILLYFASPKVLFELSFLKEGVFRFFTLEHPIMMIAAVVILTIGKKKAFSDIQLGAYRKILVYYSIALVLILAAIPGVLKF